MLIELKSCTAEDLKKLMPIYEQSNRENIRHFFPDCTDPEEGLRKAEESFGQYICEDFLADANNTYYVLEKNGQWISALRLYGLQDFYYIEALETKPDCRRMGYGAKLLAELIAALREKGAVVIRDNVDKDNLASLATHKKCSFVIEQENGVDYLCDEEVDEYAYGMLYQG